ncbi:MAG: DUF4367 domain-containing protein [Lachnospiraceae bacterium]|nr:DUF4367 domain-containing protein [Lachnospiraceae bacterium]
MKSGKVLELRLAEVFRLENEALIARAMQHIEQDGMPDYSEKYYKGIKELKQQGRKKERQYFYFGKKAASRVAVLIIALIIGALGTITAYGINRLRKPQLSMVHEGALLYYNLTEEEKAVLPEKLETVYELTWVPEEYELLYMKAYPMMGMSVYKNKTGDMISLTQSTLVGITHAIDTEGAEVAETKVLGYPAYRVVNERFVAFIWSDGEYHFSLSVPVTCKDTGMQMAESVRIKKLEE